MQKMYGSTSDKTHQPDSDNNNKQQEPAEQEQGQVVQIPDENSNHHDDQGNNTKNKSIGDEQTPNEQPQEQEESHHNQHSEHPLEGAASLETRGVTQELLEKQDQEEGPIKHIWDGQDIITFKDGSWMFCVRRPVWLNSLLLVLLIIFGGVEGFLFTHSGIVNPLAVSKQFTFQIWIVMKIFFSVVGGGLICQSIFDFLCPSFFAETRASRYNRVGYVRAAIGGSLIGLGTVLAGSGPTILPAQLGSNVGYAWVTALGMLTGGALIYFVDVNFLAKFKQPVDEHKDKMTVDEKLGIRYWKLALPAGIALFIFACMLEFVIPGTKTDDDAARIGVSTTFIYPAIAAGAWVGINQISFRLIAHHGEGGSTSYLTVLSLLTWGKIAPNNFPNQFSRLWQPAYVLVGISLGGVIAKFTDSSYIDSPGFNPVRSFFGGLFAVFGAKLGGGCICGSLLTQAFSEFGIEHIVQAIFVFAVGIPVGFIFNAAGVPDTPNSY